MKSSFGPWHESCILHGLFSHGVKPQEVRKNIQAWGWQSKDIMIDVRDEGIVLTRKTYMTSCSNLGLSWFIIIKPRNLSDRNWSISPCAHVSLHLSYSASIFLISDSKVEMHLARAVIPNMRPWVRMDS